MLPFYATIDALGFNELLSLPPPPPNFTLVSMLRAFLIYLSQAIWARHLVTRFPLARRTALRFVAGEKLEDALRVVAELNKEGFLVTLDLLGEHTENEAAASQATQAIFKVISSIAERGLRASISIKLTQFGLKLSEDLCGRNLNKILNKANAHGIFVRIDMEEAACVEATLRLNKKNRDAGIENFGLVIQSYLYRSEADTRALLDQGVPIRLVKGAYKESREIAFPKKADADAAFDGLTNKMLVASVDYVPPKRSRDTWPPLAAIASHDEARVEYARTQTAEMALPKKLVEFQMLYGIRRNLQKDLLASGYPVRIYVPFGREWYPYFLRRLAERPANLWFFVSNLFRK